MAELPDSLPPSEEEEGGPVKSFLDHLEDLRWVVLKSLGVIGVGMILAGAATKPILLALERPLLRALQMAHIEKKPEDMLQNIHPADPFFIILQVTMMGGLILAAPFVIYFLADFLLPALRKTERRYVRPAFLASVGLFLSGVVFCYFLVLPPGLMVSFKLSQYLGMQPIWRLQYYLSFVLWVLLGMGVSFQLPVVLLALVKLGILDARALRSGWRFAILGCFVVAMFIAPTGDPFTMTLLAVPLYLLYEVSVWIAYWMEHRREQQSATGHTVGQP